MPVRVDLADPIQLVGLRVTVPNASLWPGWQRQHPKAPRITHCRVTGFLEQFSGEFGFRQLARRTCQDPFDGSLERDEATLLCNVESALQLLDASPARRVHWHDRHPEHGAQGRGVDAAAVALQEVAHRQRDHRRQPQLQERLGAQLADTILQVLQPRTVGVRLVARQLCVEMRGANSPGEFTVISWRGEEPSGSLQSLLLNG